MNMPLKHDYRYTDRHVREDPRLTELACAYLKTYGGEFEPLLEAKTYLRVVGEPPTGMIRTVLNCMRHDFSVAGRMPLPQRPELPHLVSLPDKAVDRTPQPERITSAARYPVELRTVWKQRIYIATAKRATAYHHLNAASSILRYYPFLGEYKAFLRAWCGSSLATGMLVPDPPADRHECRQCVLTMIEQAEREDDRRATPSD